MNFIKKLLDNTLNNDQNGVCCICGEHYNDYGHNAQPYMNGRCCTMCNERLVVPIRHYVTMKKYAHNGMVIK